MQVPYLLRRNLSALVMAIAAALHLAAAPVFAVEAFIEPAESERRWHLTAMVGQHDDSQFLKILTLRGGNFEPSWIAGFALGRHFATTFDHVHWEIEGSLYRHWGLQHLWDGNLALVARWTWFPWDDYLNTSVAIGQGVSVASRRPPLEGDTRGLLNHLLAEVELSPSRESSLSFVLRIHHRSGVFGLFGARGGSNFVNAGVRYRF